MSVTALAASAVLLLAAQISSSGGEPGGSPKVVHTTPANGTSIPPGPFTLSVTFDRPMAAQSYSFVQTDEAPFPECTMQPRLSPDRRTYSIDCIGRPGRHHVVYFNRAPYLAFRDAQTDAAAESARLEFTVREH